MKFIDMHCDSLMMLLFHDKENADLYDSKVTSVDFKRMKEGDQLPSSSPFSFRPTRHIRCSAQRTCLMKSI